MLYIADIQRFAINPIGGGKCVESHKVIKKMSSTKIRKKFGKRKRESSLSYIAYVIYSIGGVCCE